MSANIYYCDTFLNALSNSYPAGTYVRTLGFASVGDGGAAIYKVLPEVKVSQGDTIVSGASVAGVSFNYVNGQFYNWADKVFCLVPQNGLVYAEQFGVFPGNEIHCQSNTDMLNKAVGYTSENGLRLSFASKGIYYFSSKIIIKSNLFIDGNDAVLAIYGNAATKEIKIFDMSSNTDLQHNVTIRNLTLAGRTNKDNDFADQAFHVCIDGFTLRNVSLKNFNFGIHTYGRGAGAYEVPEIPNKNWLIDNCIITDTVTGLMLSEIDGLTVKNSKISCRPDRTDLDHCIYMSANCLNVHVTNTVLCDVSGDAIHKSFAATPNVDRADISKNHFYTDLTINNADSALLFAYISENVMCDNVFATDVNVALEISGADNCIVSNSHIEQTKTTGGKPVMIAVIDACKCWVQNSYISSVGRQRVCTPIDTNSYYYQMCTRTDIPVNTIRDSDGKIIGTKTKNHRRMFIGENFDIPNHWFKFTGCKMVSYYGWDYYFIEGYNEVLNENRTPSLSQYGEYWDNCVFEDNTDQVLFRLYCINDLPGGMTVRNSLLSHKTGALKSPFRFWCQRKISNTENSICSICNNCLYAEYYKVLPWIRLENNIFIDFGKSDKWDGNYLYLTAGDLLSVNQAKQLSNSYYNNCYRNVDLSFVPIK